MRSSTFFVSFVVHALMIGIAIVVPILATDALPQLRRSTTFVTVTPEVPDLPPPAPTHGPRVQRTPAAVQTIPLSAPPSIGEERIREPMDLSFAEGAVPGGAGLAGVALDAIAIPPPPPSPPPAAPVRVGGAVRPPQKVQHVAPVYPAIARSARVTGVVIIEALIAEDGSVRTIMVLRSIPLLDQAAVDAVRQWRFTPTLLNGMPVPVIMTVTVAFTLN